MRPPPPSICSCLDFECKYINTCKARCSMWWFSAENVQHFFNLTKTCTHLCIIYRKPTKYSCSAVCCFSLWFEANYIVWCFRCFRKTKVTFFLAGRSRTDNYPYAQVEGLSRALSCMCSGGLMSEWDFIPSSCFCSLIPSLLGGNFSFIDYLSGTEEKAQTI